MGNEHKTGRANPNKAGMYFSLAVCILALALGAFSAINRRNELFENNTGTESVVEIRKNQTDVTKSTTVTTTVTTTQVSTTNQTTTKNPVANHFVMPVGGTLKKEFSNERLQYCETYGDWRLHQGIDIAAKKGTEVCSAGKGKVKKVYVDDMKGETVIIDHGNGVVCYYCGLKNVTVSKGDILEIGQKIGVIGDIPSEIADETHLHFEVTRDSKVVDPIKELELGN